MNRPASRLRRGRYGSDPERSRVTRSAGRRKSARARLGTVVRGLVILVVCVLVLFPVYWMVLSTFQPEGKTLSFPPPLLPAGFNVGASVQLFQDQPIASWLGHSLLVALIAVAITLVLAAVGAYLLGRLKWHGKLVFGLLLLFTQMMPGAMIVVPGAAVLPVDGMDQQSPHARRALRRVQRPAAARGS